MGANHASVYTLSVHCENEDFGKRTGSILEVFIFFGFGTPFYPLEANFFEPNPVGNKYSIKTGFIEYSIKNVARTSTSTGSSSMMMCTLWPKTPSQPHVAERPPSRLYTAILLILNSISIIVISTHYT